MKPFHFTLAAVLTVRQSTENAALKTYAEALLARKSAFARVAALHHELGEHWTQIRLALATQCAGAKIDQLRRYVSSLEEELVRREAVLSQAEREVSAALQKMLAARQQRQAVETFRDNQRAQYERDLMREEQKFLDDLARRPMASGASWKTTEGELA
ncbi:MAG: flagellar FliJ family protein [Verrucomicrobiales bacterium]|nr:flagellar FliJ family protein [Verrucomicrobiales bacterium]